MLNWFHSFKKGMGNIIQWIPTLYHDRPWNYEYLLIILKKKLEIMEDTFRSEYVYSAEADKNADDMRYAINLLDRMINDVYLQEALKPFNEKYPNYNWEVEFEPCNDGSGLYKMIDKDTPEQSKMLSKCYKKAEELEDKDYDELFNFLKNHIKEWWD